MARLESRAAGGWPDLVGSELEALQAVTKRTVARWIAEGAVPFRRASGGPVPLVDQSVVPCRVACLGWPGDPCGAHRDLTLMPTCMVCGARASSPVALTTGDCYSALARWAGDLLTLSPTADVVAICDAIATASLNVHPAPSR